MLHHAPPGRNADLRRGKVGGVVSCSYVFSFKETQQSDKQDGATSRLLNLKLRVFSIGGRLNSKVFPVDSLLILFPNFIHGFYE